jgi:hypothetical protein
LRTVFWTFLGAKAYPVPRAPLHSLMPERQGL